MWARADASDGWGMVSVNDLPKLWETSCGRVLHRLCLGLGAGLGSHYAHVQSWGDCLRLDNDTSSVTWKPISVS